MVSSINPSVSGAGGGLGVDQRLGRSSVQAQSQGEGALADRIEVSAGSLAGARESVGEASHQVRLALEFGQDAQALLVTVQGAARGEVSQDDLTRALSSYSEHLQQMLDEGATLLSGGHLSVQAEPGAGVVVIAGADFALGADDGVISVAADAKADDPALGAQAQRSLDVLQRTLRGFTESADALNAHQGFLGAAEAALGVRADLGAESARLTALQVRQGLEAAGATAIANAEPQAVLSLFRA
jgi:flagellin-like hook-associated protein FlgL